MTALELSTLRAAAGLARTGTQGKAGFGDLAADCGARLRRRIARPQRASGDWSIELPVSHVTRRLGRPYTLVLTKTDALFTGEQEARARDEADLAWLVKDAPD